VGDLKIAAHYSRAVMSPAIEVNLQAETSAERASIASERSLAALMMEPFSRSVKA
jgi:hypothetical protein